MDQESELHLEKLELNHFLLFILFKILGYSF